MFHLPWQPVLCYEMSAQLIANGISKPVKRYFETIVILRQNNFPMWFGIWLYLRCMQKKLLLSRAYLAELHPVPGNVASAPLTAPSLLQLPSVRLPCQSSLSVVPRGQYIVREAGDSFRRKLCKATQADTIFLMFSSLALKGRRRIRHFLASIPKAFSTNLRALLNL